MEQQLKQRLLGTVVLVAVAVIVLPLLLDGEGYRALQSIEIDAPQRPPFKYQQKDFIVPLKDLNNEILEPPMPIDVKEFNGDANEPTPPEQNEPEAEPPPTQTTVPSEAVATWVVQVGSFSIEANAAEARKKLDAMNVENTTTEIEIEKVNGQDVYVVKVVSDDYAALGEITELIKEDYPDAFIKERE